MSSIKDVAKRAGVSIATVSNVLNRSKYVSPELVKRVEDAVNDLAYEVNPIARSMKSNKSGTIGVITEDMCGVFYPYVVKGINSIAQEKGYKIMISDTQGNYGDRNAIKREKELFREMFTNRVDGIIFVSTIPDEEKEVYFAELKKLADKYKQIPIVSLERDFTDVGIDSVYFDGFANAKKAVQHLVDCGCKKIGHISGPVGMEIARERVLGYKNCLEENGLSTGEDSLIMNGDYSHQSGYIAMKKLLDEVPDIDGVFCGNDQMAVGALKVLKECGKKVPDDIKLIGYDDVFLSSVVEPSLSTIHIRKKHAGIEAAKILFQRIENPDKKDKTMGLKMESHLVIRKSTVLNAPEDWIFSDW